MWKIIQLFLDAIVPFQILIETFLHIYLPGKYFTCFSLYVPQIPLHPSSKFVKFVQ